MARFTAIPDIPTAVGAEWEAQMLDAIKQNVELLCGIRGEADRVSQALLRGIVRVRPLLPPEFTRITAVGEGFIISGQEVAGLQDYVKLLNDVQRLAIDVERMRNSFDALIQQLRG
jgi:hypothetical protein